MKKFILMFTLLIGHAFANDTISETLMKEWTHFHAMVDTIKPQGDLGGYMLYRDYQDMTLLWRTSTNSSDNEVVRFFMQRSSGVVFAVTYHKSNIINPGRTVLRRFIGTEPTGWTNHTIDLKTGEYLGSQGLGQEITSAEEKMMREWGITIF